MCLFIFLDACSRSVLFEGSYFETKKIDLVNEINEHVIKLIELSVYTTMYTLLDFT